MNCNYCNAEVSGDTKYCPNCGKSLQTPSEPNTVIGKECIVSMVMSIISFVLTTIIRFNVEM